MNTPFMALCSRFWLSQRGRGASHLMYIMFLYGFFDNKTIRH